MCFEQLEQALVSARESGKKMALLFVDLDHFKEMNDQYGHRFGDLVLQAVAKLLTSASDNADCVARLGGDEFVIFFSDVTDPQKSSRCWKSCISVSSCPCSSTDTACRSTPAWA